MRRKIVVVILILLLFGVNVSGDIDTKDASNVFDGDILYVGGSGAGNYTKIQDAINDSVDGDTVFVYDDSSPYYENLVLETTIKLIGEDRDTTVIDGNYYGKVIEVFSNDSIISGFTVKNSGREFFDAGIFLRGRGDITENNKLINNENGIFLYFGFPYSLIRGNIICENDFGIRLCATNFSITENYIYNNKRYGIHSYNPIRDGNISKNIICNNSHGILITVGGGAHIFGNIITKSSIIGISFVNSNHNTIENNDIRDNNYGVYNKYCIWNTIKKNNFINNTNHSFFIDNSIVRYLASILGLKYSPFKNIFLMNYWDNHNTSSPKLIEGELHYDFPIINIIIISMAPYGGPNIEIPIIERKMFDYDYNPASEPYDIEV